MLELVNILVHHHLPENSLKPKNSSVADHLIFCNYSASDGDFSILTREDKVFIRIERKPANNER